MKILLLTAFRHHSLIPLGVGYIASTLEKAGFENIKLIDFPIIKEIEIRSMIQKEKPDICGISCYTDTRNEALELAKIIKGIDKNIFIIFGNSHSTLMWEQLLTHYPFIDLIVLGEGERVMVNILESLNKSKDYRSIRGIAFRKNGYPVRTENEKFIDNLDEIPYPAYHLMQVKNKRTAIVITSRGCPYKCQFCSSSSFWGRRWRSRSALNVFGELDLLVNKYNIKEINFTDDYFLFDQKRTIEICQEIIKKNLFFTWSVNGRVDKISNEKYSREMFEWMKKAGCQKVSFGIESGSPLILKTIRKEITPEQIINAYQIVFDAGISSSGSLMVGNPNESDKTIDETISLLEKLSIKREDYKQFSIANTVVYPGTELYIFAKQKGFIDDNYWLSKKVAPYYTAELSNEYIDKLKARIIFFIFKKIGILNSLRYILERIFPIYDEGKGKPNFRKLFRNMFNLSKSYLRKALISVDNKNGNHRNNN